MQTAYGTHEQQDGGNSARTLMVIAGWFLTAVWLGVTGAFAASWGTPPIGIGVAICAPLVAFAVDRRLGHPLFGALTRLEVPALVALQTSRILGVTFVVGWLAGSLPGGFALPAGLGDMAVGLSAPLVAAAVANRRRDHLAWLKIWNAVGMLDLVVAVSLGILHSGSSLGILRGPTTTNALAVYPLNLIPTFFVPLAMLMHFLVWRAIRRGRLTVRA